MDLPDAIKLVTLLIGLSLSAERFLAIWEKIFPGLQLPETTLPSSTDANVVLSKPAVNSIFIPRVLLLFAGALLTISFITQQDTASQWSPKEFVAFIKFGSLGIPKILLAFLATLGSKFWIELLDWLKGIKDTSVTNRQSEALERLADAEAKTIPKENLADGTQPQAREYIAKLDTTVQDGHSRTAIKIQRK